MWFYFAYLNTNYADNGGGDDTISYPRILDDDDDDFKKFSMNFG